MGETCCVKRYSNWQTIGCTKPAKVERDGKFYCTIHDPVRVAEKRSERNAKRDAENKARWAERDRATAEADLKNRALATIRLIAEGHNDPRALAVEVLATPEPAR